MTTKKTASAKKAHNQSAEKPAQSAAHTPPVKARAAGQPVFNQPVPSPDPSSFSKSVTDKKLKGIVKLEPFPTSGPDPGVLVEPVLTLAQVYGSAGQGKEAAITKAGQIVFHCVGDTGSVSGPQTQDLVADKMVTDFVEDNAIDVPSFFFHLGDVVYYFGEATYYYDQFYESYRNYPAPILAIPGNHDGVVYPNDTAQSLGAFISNFCTPTPAHSPDAGGLNRTTMIQPAVYFTLEAPFVRIFGLYSNVLEDPGVISSQKGTSSSNTLLDDRQLAFLTAGLKRVTSDGFSGAVIIATHHPPFTGGSASGLTPCSRAMRTTTSATPAPSAVNKSRSSSPVAEAITRSRPCAPPCVLRTSSATLLPSTAWMLLITATLALSSTTPP
jgi:hypothetical protein